MKNRGKQFEQKVYDLLLNLEKDGFISDVRYQERVLDRDKNPRYLDFSFCTLSIPFFKFRVSVECKSRKRNITISEIDQIKVFQNETERNIFLLITEKPLSKSAENAIRKRGIEHITYDELVQAVSIVKNNCEKLQHIQSKIDSLMCEFHEIVEPLGYPTLNWSQMLLNEGISLERLGNLVMRDVDKKILEMRTVQMLASNYAFIKFLKRK
jgi:hypothetical protein